MLLACSHFYFNPIMFTLPRCAAECTVIARPKTAAIHGGPGTDMDCRASLAMTQRVLADWASRDGFLLKWKCSDGLWPGAIGRLKAASRATETDGCCIHTERPSNGHAAFLQTRDTATWRKHSAGNRVLLAKQATAALAQPIDWMASRLSIGSGIAPER